MNFLVVDDSDTMRRIIRKALRRIKPSKILEARDAEEAWNILSEQRVDFILCDWNMPGMKGIELLSKVRASKELGGIPFVMVSAEARSENIMEAVKRGVTNYVTKPFTADMLAKKIEVILRLQNGEELSAAV
jgi:two-component system chemotaxis response regulator CheY